MRPAVLFYGWVRLPGRLELWKAVAVGHNPDRVLSGAYHVAGRVLGHTRPEVLALPLGEVPGAGVDRRR